MININHDNRIVTFEINEFCVSEMHTRGPTSVFSFPRPDRMLYRHFTMCASDDSVLSARSDGDTCFGIAMSFQAEFELLEWIPDFLDPEAAFDLVVRPIPCR